jgi:hypothetical protein
MPGTESRISSRFREASRWLQDRNLLASLNLLEYSKSEIWISGVKTAPGQKLF